ncbi:MAG: hypothetical protein ACJASR_001754 [Psychroserpens sp.]|jgi:hypothetical protein
MVENEYVKFWIDNGIMHSDFKEHTIIGIEKAKDIVQLRHEISANQKQYWCFNISLLKEYKKDARDYAEIHGQEFLYATALVLNSHITRFIFNTYMKLKKTEMPIQAFKSKEDAVSWLNELKRINEGKHEFTT